MVVRAEIEVAVEDPSVAEVRAPAPPVIVSCLKREADDVVVLRVRCHAYLQPCGGKACMIVEEEERWCSSTRGPGDTSASFKRRSKLEDHYLVIVVGTDGDNAGDADVLAQALRW